MVAFLLFLATYLYAVLTEEEDDPIQALKYLHSTAYSYVDVM